MSCVIHAIKALKTHMQAKDPHLHGWISTTLLHKYATSEEGHVGHG